MRRHKKTGLIAVAFGGGLIISFICPTNFIVVILSVAVVVLGASFLKC